MLLASRLRYPPPCPSTLPKISAACARSGPQIDYGFPGMTCISVSDEAVQGTPGRRRLRRGDLVKLDVTAELDGFYADACRTVVVGDGRPQALKLIRASEQALDAALKVVRAGVVRAGAPLILTA